jgi:secreted PhoX family phosphatase
VTPIGTNWVVTTLAGLAGTAGSTDGTNSAARFNGVIGIAVDNAGSLYVSDFHNNTIRKVTPIGTNWVVTTLAGLAGTAGSADATNAGARFNGLGGLVVDGAGSLFLADFYNNTIRRATPVGTNWVVTTLAGLAGIAGSADGTNNAARFGSPDAVAIDTAGNLYVADSSTIRKVAPLGTNWVVRTLGGARGSFASKDGTGSGAWFTSTAGLAVDTAGNLYVADSGTIRKGIPANSVPPPTLYPPSLTAGQLGFGITGLFGLEVSVEYSYNLSQWGLLSTFSLVGGTNYYTFSTSVPGYRFFRVVVH